MTLVACNHAYTGVGRLPCFNVVQAPYANLRMDLPSSKPAVRYSIFQLQAAFLKGTAKLKASVVIIIIVYLMV